MINYFENLGFGDSVNKALNTAQGVQSLLANQQAMQMNQAQAERQAKADESAILRFADDQQKQRAAQGAGAFYNALNSGNTQGALQIASQFQDDINTLGDPSFTVETVAQLAQTPEGVEQLKQMSLGMIQLAAGPEQMARFTAQSVKTESSQEATAQIKNTAEYRRYTDAIRQAVSSGDKDLAKSLMQERDFFVNQVDPYARAYATGQGAGTARIATEQQLSPVLAQRAGLTAEAQQSTAGGQAQLVKDQAEAQAAQAKIQDEQTRKAAQIDLSRQTQRLAREIANSANLNQVTGIGAMVPTINPQSQDLVLKAEQLISLLTADNLKLMSGVLTDKDIQMLQTLSSGMRVTDKGIRGSAPAIRKRLTEIADSIDKKLGAQQQPVSQQSGVVVDWSSL